MKPLNRPMFRYGGPIKEGVMSGIREPKKNGGSMSNNQGKYLVGDPVYPKTDGRAHHAIFGGAGIAAALAAAARYGKPIFQAGKRIFGTTTPASVKQGSTLSAAKAVKEFGPGSGRVTLANINPAKFNPNFLGGDPILRTLVGSGKVGSKIVKPAAKFAFGSPTGLALSAYGGKQIYDALNSDPTVDSDGDGVSDVNAAKAAIGMPENLTLGGGQKIKTGGDGGDGVSASDLAKSRMEANRKKYYEIMGIDKMGRQATGDALINASRAINQLNTQGIGIKEGLKSGQLQNLIIEGISSAMDKPSKTKDAVDAAILKAEIQKDIDAGKGGTYAQNAKDYAKMKYGVVNAETMAKAYDDLGFNKSTTFAEDLIANAKNMGGAITSDVLSTTIQSSLGIVPEVLYDATSMVEVRKSDDFTNDKSFAIAATKNKEPGVYVVDTVAVAVDESGNQKVLFSG